MELSYNRGQLPPQIPCITNVRPRARYRLLLFKLEVSGLPEAPGHYKPLPLVLFIPPPAQNLMVRPYYCICHMLEPCKIERESWCWLEASSPLASVHSAGGCYTGYYEKNNNITQLWNLPVTETTGLSRYAHCCHSRQMLWGEPTTSRSI